MSTLKSWHKWAFTSPLTFLLLEGCALLSMRGLDARAAPWSYVGLYGLAFVGFAAASHLVLEKPEVLSPGRLLLIALLLRIIALICTPELSDDLYRYLWEGRVGLHNFSPYLYSPEHQALLPLRDEIYRQVNHHEISSIYPPLAQWIFQGIAWVGYHPITVKLTFGILDLGTAAIVIRLLKREEIPSSFAVLYAWNPLPLVEFAGNGHLDSAAIALLLLALLANPRRLKGAAIMGLLLAASTLIKVFALGVLPIFVACCWRAGGKRSALLCAGTTLGIIMLAYAPHLQDGTALWDGLRQYGEHWQFNGSIYPLLRTLLDNRMARLLTMGTFALLSIGLAWHKVPPPQAIAVCTGAFFLLSPTVHPWYLCWIAPLLPLFPRRPWLLLTGTVGLAYTVFSGADGWEELEWIPWLEYGSCALLGLWELGRQATHRGCGQPCG